VVAVVNMVDDAEDYDTAREIAERVVAEPQIDAVALTSLIADEPVRELYR